MIRPAFIILMLISLTVSAQDKPRRPWQLFEEADKQFSHGNYQQTLALLDECLKTNPLYMEAYPLRAGAREQLNDLDGALTDYSIYLEKFPTHTDVLMSRAVL